MIDAATDIVPGVEWVVLALLGVLVLTGLAY